MAALSQAARHQRCCARRARAAAPPARRAPPLAPLRCRRSDRRGGARAPARCAASSVSPVATDLQDIARTGKAPPPLSAGNLHAGGPRFWSPLEAEPPSDGGAPDLRPLLVFVPGLDGTGFAASRQFQSLSELYAVQCLTIPSDDRSSARELAEAVERHCRGLALAFPRRRICLLGESMGGLIATLAAARLGAVVSHLILVNPATSFARTPWATAGPLLPLLPDQAYEALPLAMSPILLDPQVIVRSAADAATEGDDALPDAAAAAERVGSTLSAFQATLLDALPKATLAHRLRVLQQGADELAALEASRQGLAGALAAQRVLVVVGARDALLPSAEEGRRLKEALAPGSCTLVELPEVAHALLQDPSVSLSRVVQEAAFYSPSGAGSGGKALATFVPPADEDLSNMRQSVLAVQRAAHAPVFLSTDAATGAVRRGLGAFPAASEGRPVLLVGNHQLMAPDLGLLIDTYVAEKGEWLRGLAHPAVFAAADQVSGGGDGAGGGGGGAFFRRFGALPVSGRTLHAVLAAGQPALLFPGGVREAYKRRGEQYELFWPSSPEFARMAAKHDALIVPIAAVGAEDSMEIVLDSTQQQELPFGLGERARQRAAAMPNVSDGQREAELGESFVAPVVRPTEPDRWYFRAMAPIDTAQVDHRDADAAAQLYAQVRDDVAEGMRYLLAAREADELRTLGARAAWAARRGAEATLRGEFAPISAEDAPTFDLDREY